VGIITAIVLSVLLYPLGIGLAIALAKSGSSNPASPNFDRPRDCEIKTKDDYARVLAWRAWLRNPGGVSAPQVRQELMGISIEELCAMYEEEV